MTFQSVGLYLLSPLSLALLMLLGAGVLRAAGRGRSALWLAVTATVLLWFCSTPWLAETLLVRLESQYPALAPQDTPSADAIVVLGGAVAGAKPPHRPTLMLGPSSTRVWHAAALYRAKKAPWVVVAAGNRSLQASEQVEADAISEMLVQLGVPPAAIVREGASRTTIENARNIRRMLDRLHARRVLLVTSAQHMPRAMKTFVKIWGPDGPQPIPAVTDVEGPDEPGPLLELWFPSLGSLLVVTKALKEFAGTVVLAIIL